VDAMHTESMFDFDKCELSVLRSKSRYSSAWPLVGRCYKHMRVGALQDLVGDLVPGLELLFVLCVALALQKQLDAFGEIRCDTVRVPPFYF